MVPFTTSTPGEGESTLIEAKQASGVIPDSWYTSPDVYQLERRSLFSRKWLLVTHKSRFARSGDFLKFETGGFEFVITKDRDGRIHGFHNVCRHRAFPVVTEERGTAKIFSCKYHGWSYGLNGKLAKAPGYQDLPTFDKSKNSLFPVHVHIDQTGFVWANLDGKARPETNWGDDLPTDNELDQHEHINLDDYEFDHISEIEHDQNWKTVIEHVNRRQADMNGNKTTDSAFYFPNTLTNTSSHMLSIRRFVPIGATKTVMKCEVYRNKHSSDKDFQTATERLKDTSSTVPSEEEASNNHSSEQSRTALQFLFKIRDEITQHHRREEELRREIWPAAPPPSENASISEEDVDFCTGLACSPAQQQQIVW